MRTAPRVLECAGCGVRQRLFPDVLPIIELPAGWREVGPRRNGLRRDLPTYLCPACVALAKKDPVETGSVSV
jgi:hypothetical protein